MKRANSTAQPEYSGWYSTSAVWKQHKDIDHPTISIFTDIDPAEYNYMVIPEYETFYWVTGIVTVGANRWEISAMMDELATYRDAIRETTCFIEYGFNSDASGAVHRLQDSRQNVSMVPRMSYQKKQLNPNINPVVGCYVLCAVGKSGGVTAYMILRANMVKLLDSIGTEIDASITGIDDVQELLKYFTKNSLAQGSAVQAIRSCTWLPVLPGAYPESTAQKIYLGEFDTGVTGLLIGNRPLFTFTEELTIPWPADDWKRMNCQILLYLPFSGTVGIPTDQCNNCSTLEITYSVELITGGVAVRVDAVAGDARYTVYTGTGNMGVPYAIGSSNIPIQNIANGGMQALTGQMQFGTSAVGAMGAIGSLLVGDIQGAAEGAQGAAMSAVNGASGYMAGIMQSLSPVVQCAGSLGGSAAMGQSLDLELELLYYPPIDDAAYQGLYGYPVMRVSKPVKGYCKTRGFSLIAGARASELARVNAMMDAGVFIED